LGVTGGLTSINATTCTGILTANGGITATAGIGTTTLTASGLITASNGIITTTLTASGLITASNGIITTTLIASGLITASNGIITTTLIASDLITASNGIITTTLTASGLITAQTPSASENSTIVPTTAWVNTAIGTGGSKWSSTTNGIYYSSGNVGIGTTDPGYNLDVSGNARIRGRTYFGIDNPGGGTGDTAYMEYVAISGEQTTLRINVQNDTDDNINLNPTGNVGINTDTPAYKLDVNGNVGATSYNTTSDYRIKKDVVTLNDSFTVDKLRPVTYNNTKLDKQDIGLIAHEVQEIYPFLVTGEKDGENFQTVNYTGLIGILIKEIQELKERVKKLEEK
jgi:hypothetical protein